MAPGPKPWDWRSLETGGLGGSETAAVYVAEGLAKAGHNVVLRGLVSAPPSPAGVHYVGIQDSSGPVTADAVIVSRVRQWLPMFNAPLKMFWSHDLIQPDDAPTTPGECGGIMALSKYHAQCFPGRNVLIFPNGVDLALFDGWDKAERVRGKMAWTSNWDRGLFPAIVRLQQLRKRWPELELHVYGNMSVYGWSDDREKYYVPQDTTGVVFHGALNKRDLAKELMTCWAWYYPTYWPETFCIAALEAEAAGTPCITVPIGALPETVVAPKPSFDIEQTVENLMFPSTWMGQSKKARRHAEHFPWDGIASGLAGILASNLEPSQ